MADNKVSVPELNGPGSQAPELNAIVGCAGAGKTTVRVAFRLDDPRWPHHLNFDEYRHALKDQFNDPVFAATKLCALPAAVFDSLNWSTRSLIMSMADSYMARRQSFSMETTGDDGLFPIIRKARYAGYRVHGAIVLTKDPYINIARIRKRAFDSRLGKNIVDQSVFNEKEILANYSNIMASIYKTLEMFATCLIVDNSGISPRKLLRKEENGQFYSNDVPVSLERAHKIIADLDYFKNRSSGRAPYVEQ